MVLTRENGDTFTVFDKRGLLFKDHQKPPRSILPKVRFKVKFLLFSSLKNLGPFFSAPLQPAHLPWTEHSQGELDGRE